MTKNHYALCIVARGRYDFYRKILGVEVWVGAYTFRTTILGKGQRGAQRMDFEMEMDDWDEDGLVNPRAELDVDFNCQNYPNAECSTTNFGGRDDTVAGWQRNGFYHALFDTSASPGGGDLIHYDFDKVNYHDFQIVMDSARGAWVFHHPFRCDAAAYASGGACIYHRIDAVMHYRLTPLTPEENVYEVARHIKDAQDDPENVKPGGIGTAIPGGKASGVPLTRLVEDIDPAAKTFAQRSGDIIERDCARYFTPAEREGKDCDEYPFNSTWQGAAFTEQFPGSKWKFSVRPLDRTQNRRAGAYLVNWYTDDHILAKDPFWMTILP